MKEAIKKYFDLNDNTTYNADGIADSIEELTMSCYATRSENELSFLMGYLKGLDDASSLSGGNINEYIIQMVQLSEEEFIAWIKEDE